MNQKPVAVVTGGNRGMGLATCLALAEKGFHSIADESEFAIRKACCQGFDESGLFGGIGET